MKKLMAFILLVVTVLSLSSCENTTPIEEKEALPVVNQSSVSSTVTSAAEKKYNENYFQMGELPETSSFVSSSAPASSSKPQPEREEILSLTYNGYYYKNLSVAQKRIYKLIDAAVFNMTIGYIELGKCNYSDILLAFKAVMQDRPEYFWMSNEYILSTQSNGEYKIAFSGVKGDDMDYLVTRQERSSMQTALSSAYLEVKALADTVPTDYEKELIVHDWLVNRAVYDEETEKNYSKNMSKESKLSFTSYGGMVRREGKLESVAVCEGYARAFQYILNRMGIECTIIGGKVDGQGHLWNAVKIDSKWYNVDVTLNDADGDCLHTYFNVTDKQLSLTHESDKDFYDVKISIVEKGSFNLFKPECTANKYNYYVVNSTVISSLSNSAETIAKKIEQNYDLGVCEFSFSQSVNYSYNANTVMDTVNVDKIIELIEKSKGVKLAFRAVGATGAKSFKLYWMSSIV